jgi:hypothetical protein
MQDLKVEKETSNQVFTTDPGALIEIMQKIIAQHQLAGSESPLNPKQIADLNYRVSFVKAKHEEGLKYQKLMQSAWAERDSYLSVDKGCIGTLKQAIQNVCLFLRDIYKRDTKELSKWGL